MADLCSDEVGARNLYAQVGGGFLRRRCQRPRPLCGQMETALSPMPPARGTKAVIGPPRSGVSRHCLRLSMSFVSFDAPIGPRDLLRGRRVRGPSTDRFVICIREPRRRLTARARSAADGHPAKHVYAALPTIPLPHIDLSSN